MSFRNLTLAATVCIAASVAAFGQPGAGYVFQLPGLNASNGQIVGYPYAANPLAASVNVIGPNGTYQIIPKVDGSGYYVLGSALQVANPTFTTFTSVNGIASAPTALATSPDGKYAVVGAGSLYVLSAASSQVLATLNTAGTIVGVVVSQDSQNAYVLSNAPYGSIVTQISLASMKQVGTPLQLSGGATSLAFSPLGLLYVGAVNRVFEINPATLALTTNGTMTPNATPGPLHFTPDGTTMYFANTTSNVTGGSVVQITLANYGIASWPPANGTTPTPINDVLIAGNSRIFAISTATSTLFDVSTSPLSLSVSSLNTALNGQAQNVLAAALSNELPSSLYLYLVIGSTSSQNVIYRVTLSTNQVSSQVNASLSGGTLAFVGVPPQSGASSFIQYNANQTVAQGATSLPLIAQVLDGTGRPVFNQPVTFTTPVSGGIVINAPNVTTNANGFAQTTIVAPAAAGTYTVTLTAGTANITYTINVPGAGGTSGTGTGGFSQVTIVTGNGQLVPQGYATVSGCTGDPLTVLVTDVNGVPLPGVSVTFSVTSGTGNLATYYSCTNNNLAPNTTDANGLAYANFVGQLPAGGYDFEQDTIVAVTPYGSVSFTETEYAYTQTFNGPEFPPTVQLLTPTVDTSRTVTVPVGGVAQNAVTALILANSVPQLNCPTSSTTTCPIPNIAIRIVDPNNIPAASPYASCQGSTLSDQTGTAHCSVVATCSAAPGIYPVGYIVGDQPYWLGNVVITKGSAQALSIVSGNNQSGSAGTTLGFPLVAKVTDACGNAAAGGTVTWTVTQGSATLSQIVATSGSSGQVSAVVTLGSTPGPVQVTATFGTASIVTFTLTDNAVVTSMTILNGNNQSVTVGNPFPQSLTVQIKDANGNPTPGVTVNFAITSGTGSLNPTSALTDTQGRASTIATASANPGLLVVTASYASVSATFNETVIAQGPVVTATNFQNAASFQTGLVPCGLATATGSGLAPGITGTVSGASFLGPLPYTLNGLSLSVNGVPAPIYQLSNTNGKQQVTFQTPCEISPSSNGTVVITLNGVTTTVPGVSILQAQPGIFYSIGSNGTDYGELIDSNGNYVTATNPAKRGQNYYLIATGLGQTSPATATDRVGVNGESVALQVIVGVSNSGVPVFEQIYQPGAVGIYVIGFTIPTTLQTTNGGIDQPLALGVIANGQTIFSNTVYINSVQ
jgi:uncharacterized protein (TIGR03437 family)